MTTDPDVFVGARVDHNGAHGTVKYIGDVPPTQGIWLGVEWDDPNRGKHDGSAKDGKRYFSTSSPTSGSFIRPKVISRGTTFMREVQEKYGRVEEEGAGVDEEEMFVVGRGRQLTTVEMVGAHKVNLQQSKFDSLLEIGMRGTLLSTPGDVGVIRQTLPCIVELDVSMTLLHSWETVNEIAQQLPNLQILNVSDNRLTLPEQPETYQKCFPCVKTLILNRMGYTWSEVLRCGRMMPYLQRLHVCFNKIESLTESDAILPNLKLLNLEGNSIQNWLEVLKLSSLPHLKELILNDIGVSSITFPDVLHGAATNFFSNLSSISLSNNNISDWASIDELNKLQNLTELKFRRNPVCGKDTYTDRYLALAKLKRLQLLDRSIIEADERKGAELDYLKKFGLAWKAAGGHQEQELNKPNAEFNALHPRYQDLINKYGPPEDSELKIGSSALKNNLINVTIKVPQDASKKEMKKKLPLSMSVQKLKVLLSRLYRMNPGDMKLTYISAEMPDNEVELEGDQKEIGFYSIMEGDCVLLHT